MASFTLGLHTGHAPRVYPTLASLGTGSSPRGAARPLDPLATRTSGRCAAGTGPSPDSVATGGGPWRTGVGPAPPGSRDREPGRARETALATGGAGRSRRCPTAGAGDPHRPRPDALDGSGQRAIGRRIGPRIIRGPRHPRTACRRPRMPLGCTAAYGAGWPRGDRHEGRNDDDPRRVGQARKRAGQPASGAWIRSDERPVRGVG